MASPHSPSRRQQQPQPLVRSALCARDALVLEHLPLADALASAAARRFFPLVEREDLIQVAREALVRAAPRCITGALQHLLRDRVRLVRISRREHEKGTWPIGHTSLDVPAAGESRPRPCGSPSSRGSRCGAPGSSRLARWPFSGPRRRPSPPCASSWRGRAEAPTGFLPGPWQKPEDPPPSGSMNPLLPLLGAAVSNGLLTAQIVFSTAFVGACELPNWIQAPRQVNACLERWMTVSALFFPSGMQTEAYDLKAEPQTVIQLLQRFCIT